MIEWAPVIMAKFHQGSRQRLSRSRDEDPFEFSGRLALFHDVYAKGNVGFTLLGKSSLKRSPFRRSGAQTDRANRRTHRKQKSDGAFRDDHVNGMVP